MTTATATLYETDFYGWIQSQVAALRAGQLGALDRDNLIEEIDDMGKREKQELRSRLTVLLMHLLKWQYQPGFRGSSWQATVKEQRFSLADHLLENPSLKSLLPETVEKAYRYAVLAAVKETGISESTFPAQCPWTIDQAMDDGFWPHSDGDHAARLPANAT